MWDWSDTNVCVSIDLDQLLTRTTTTRLRAKKKLEGIWQSQRSGR